MRAAPPPSIRLFALAYGLQLALGIAHWIGTMNTMQAQFSSSVPTIVWDTASLSVAIAVRSSIALLPLWLILARASRFARWVATILIASRLYYLPDTLAGIAKGDAMAALYAASLAIGLFAVACLFRRDSRQWFASRRHPIESDAQAFG